MIRHDGLLMQKSTWWIRSGILMQVTVSVSSKYKFASHRAYTVCRHPPPLVRPKWSVSPSFSNYKWRACYLYVGTLSLSIVCRFVHDMLMRSKKAYPLPPWLSYHTFIAWSVFFKSESIRMFFFLLEAPHLSETMFIYGVIKCPWSKTLSAYSKGLSKWIRMALPFLKNLLLFLRY